MRKPALILSLVAVLLLATASDAFAQRRGGGGRYNGGRGGRGGNWGWSNPSIGLSIGVGGGYYGTRGYYGGRGYYYDSPYYYESAPVYSDSVTQIPATEARPSFYSDPNSATMMVLVPNADAEVWFDGAPTTQRGMERMFNTPALQQAGFYTIRARWNENGRAVDQQRQVRVQPGQSITVDFRVPASEKIPVPRTPQN